MPSYPKPQVDAAIENPLLTLLVDLKSDQINLLFGVHSIAGPSFVDLHLEGSSPAKPKLINEIIRGKSKTDFNIANKRQISKNVLIEV